jgi:hypothetical protein
VIIDEIGGGLIAGGSLMLPWTFLGSNPGESVGEIERVRRAGWAAMRVESPSTP